MSLSLRSVLYLILLSIGVQSTRADESEKRVLHFPNDRSIGVVHIRMTQPPPEQDLIYGEDWKFVAEARGDVAVPAVAQVRLNVSSAAAEDLTLLGSLGAQDLHALNLTSTRLTDAGLEHVGKLTGLKMLDMGQTRITDAGTRHLKDLRELVSINLDAWSVDQEGFGVGNATLQMMAINKWNKLERISLRLTKVTDEGMTALSILKSLRTVSIAGAPVSDPGMERLRRLTSLQSLSLGVYEDGAKVTDVGLEQIGQMTWLKHLDLSGTKVSNDGLKQLGPLVNLESLSLDMTKITDAGFVHLAPLQKLTSLRVYLDGPITDRGAMHLAKLSSLKRLNAHLSLTEQGLQAMSNLPLLENISLNGEGVTDEALAPIGKMKSLKELWFQGCPITDRGLAELSRLDNLEYLLIGRTKVTTEGLGHLKRLPRFNRLAANLLSDDGGQAPQTMTHIAEMKGLTWLSLRTPHLPSSELIKLKSLTGLKQLELTCDASVDDDVAIAISALTSLETLSIGNSKLTDVGLAHLSTLQKLQYATISGDFTPVGLHSLAALHSLLRLQVASRFITEDDLKDFTKRMPSVQNGYFYEDFFQLSKEITPNEQDGIRRVGLAHQRVELNKLEGAPVLPFSIKDWVSPSPSKSVDLKQFQDKVLLVQFFSLQDRDLVPTMTKLRQLLSKYQQQKFAIVSIQATNDAAKLADFVTSQKLTWPVGIDQMKQTTEDWNVKSSPRFFLIDRSGDLRIAGVYFPDIEKAIKLLLQE